MLSPALVFCVLVPVVGDRRCVGLSLALHTIGKRQRHWRVSLEQLALLTRVCCICTRRGIAHKGRKEQGNSHRSWAPRSRRAHQQESRWDMPRWCTPMGSPLPLGHVRLEARLCMAYR